MFDLRYFIGAFFVIVGLLLLVAPHASAPMADYHVNVQSGSAMLVFGSVLLWLALRGRSSNRLKNAGGKPPISSARRDV